jgi:hypothetical protein
MLLKLPKIRTLLIIVAFIDIVIRKLSESVLGKSSNVIPSKVGIWIVEFTFWIALKSFTSCPASTGMTEIPHSNRLI